MATNINDLNDLVYLTRSLVEEMRKDEAFESCIVLNMAHIIASSYQRRSEKELRAAYQVMESFLQEYGALSVLSIEREHIA